jgi:hypothetical protein
MAIAHIGPMVWYRTYYLELGLECLYYEFVRVSRFLAVWEYSRQF